MASSQGDIRASPMAYQAVRTLPKLPLPLRPESRDAEYLLVRLPVRPVDHQAQSLAIALRSPATERSSEIRYSPDIHTSGTVAAKTPATSTARDAEYLLVGLLVRPVGHQAQYLASSGRPLLSGPTRWISGQNSASVGRVFDERLGAMLLLVLAGCRRARLRPVSSASYTTPAHAACPASRCRCVRCA